MTVKLLSVNGITGARSSVINRRIYKDCV